MEPSPTAKTTVQPFPGEDWSLELPPVPEVLVYDDGEPLESNRHRIAMNVLIDSTLQAYADRTDFFVGGNMFVYYSDKQIMNREFRGPDYFVVLDVDGDRERKAWILWEEAGRYPDVIVELMSPTTAAIDLGEKKHLYARTFQTSHYFVYDPFDPTSLQGWRLDQSHSYQSLTPNQHGWLWCEPLHLWFGLWDGRLRREPATETCQWLRLFDPQEHLILLQEEVAELERQRAEAERQRAEAERQRAEAERQRAEAERQRAERLAARLRELGGDPGQL